MLPPEQLLQRRFSFEQRQNSEILAVQPEQVEGDEDALAPAKQQIAEVRPAALVQTRDLSIEHGALDAEVFGEPCREFCEAAEDVSVSGDQFRTTILKVGEGTEAVDLQLEDVIIGVERLGAAGKADGAEVSGEHQSEDNTSDVRDSGLTPIGA